LKVSPELLDIYQKNRLKEFSKLITVILEASTACFVLYLPYNTCFPFLLNKSNKYQSFFIEGCLCCLRSVYPLYSLLIVSERILVPRNHLFLLRSVNFLCFFHTSNDIDPKLLSKDGCAFCHELVIKLSFL